MMLSDFLTLAWKQCGTWPTWAKRLFCPLIVAPFAYFIGLFFACILTNFYWYLFRIDTGFWLTSAVYWMVGIAFTFNPRKVWLIFWLVVSAVVTVVTTVGYDWKSWVCTAALLPLAVTLCYFALDPKALGLSRSN